MMSIIHNIEVQKEGYVKLRLEALRSMSPKSEQAPPFQGRRPKRRRHSPLFRILGE